MQRTEDIDKVLIKSYNNYMTEDLDNQCIIATCKKDIANKTNALCWAHYMRKRRHGSPLAGRKSRELIIGGNGRNHPLYKTWDMMIQRCTNVNHPSYKRYGGRGIRVCDEWRQSFNAFALYMGPKPSPSHTIDRIDHDGDYRPGNVRWSTRSTQAFNKGVSRMNTSGVRGVGYRKDTKKWVASYKKDGISLRISNFETPQQAAAQREEWERLYGC
jgi:hypothetical protein